MSPAFALTEYKVQGSTYWYRVLDLARRTYGMGRDAIHARHCSGYVKLSRLQMMENLWLLEPITLRDLRNEMHPELVAEDLRLQRLAAATLQRETVSSPVAV